MRDESSQGSLYKIGIDDPSPIPLLTGTGDVNDEIFNGAIYSPNGAEIAYIRWGGALINESQIWVMSEDGTNRRQLTSGQSDWYPAWSPSGSHIAFSRSEGSDGGIYVMRSDGSELTQITDDRGRYPIWIQ